MFISYKDLEKEQGRDLDYKIETFDKAVADAFKVRRRRTAIAFSGGKDSTVLWHRILTKFPEEVASA